MCCVSASLLAKCRYIAICEHPASCATRRMERLLYPSSRNTLLAASMIRLRNPTTSPVPGDQVTMNKTIQQMFTVYTKFSLHRKHGRPTRHAGEQQTNPSQPHRSLLPPTHCSHLRAHLHPHPQHPRRRTFRPSIPPFSPPATSQPEA